MVLGIKWMQGKHHGHALLDEDGDLDTEYIDDEDAKTEKQLARERERADRQNNGADEFASGPPSFASDASHDAMGSPGPKSPSDHAARKWLRKTQSRRGASKSFSQPAISYAEQMRLEALQEYQSRLAEPMKLDNETLISFASRVVIELEMRPYKTIKTLHSKTFTGADFIEWSMTQPEVRDQCDALFIGNELMSRGIFLPVSYGATEALFYSPTFKSSSGVMRLVCKKKAQIVAAVLGADLDTIGDLSSKRDSNASSPGAGNSASSSPRHGELSRDGSGKIDVGDVRRTASDPTSGSSSSSPAAAGGAGGESKFKLRRCPTVDERRGNVSTLKAVPEGRILRKFTNAVGGGINRRVLSTRAKFAAIARPIHGYLHTRLGPHVLFAALLPFLLLCVFHATTLAAVAVFWGASHVADVDWKQRRDLERRVRAEELKKFQGKRGNVKVYPDGSESADWWSCVLQSFWDGWLEMWLNRLLTNILTDVLERVKPSYLESLKITEFKLGSNAPTVKTSRLFPGPDGETILEWDIVWQTEEMRRVLSHTGPHTTASAW